MGDRSATYLDLENINFDGLAAVTIEALCSCAGSNSDATDKALQNLNAMDVNRCRNLSQLLAMELNLWQACYRELDDPPMATYLRLKNLKAACARDNIWCDLITAFNDITSRDKHIKLQKVKSWNTIESKLSEAWDLVCNQGLLLRFDSLIDEDSSIDAGSRSSEDSPDLSAHHSNLPRRNNDGTFGDKATADLQDKQLVCKDCRKEFLDPKDDQAHRRSRGWTNHPSRCQPCKAIHLEALTKNPQPCSDFEAGKCTYGDRCRYLHVKREKPAANCAECLSFSDSDSDSIDLECY